MLYTPNKDNYIQELKLRPGMSQEIPFDRCQFDMNYIVGYELYKTFHTYYPIVFSVNYTKDGKQYAFMTYG